MQKLTRQHKAFIILMLLVTLMLFYKPTQVHHFWFDEGWTLSIARNWVEFGHYGERSAGEFVPSTILNTGFPATSLYALTFRLFGVGMFQARVLGNIIVIVCLVLLYVLVNQVFDKETALIAQVLVIFTSITEEMSPLFTGRQALGEMPMLMFVLAGFISLTALRHRHYLWSSIASIFFALAIHTKPQVLPFLVFGLVAGIVMVFLSKDRDAIRHYVWLLLSTAILYALLGWGWSSVSRHFNKAKIISSDPYAMVRDIKTLLTYVIVLNTDVRLNVFWNVLTRGINVLGGLGIMGVTRQTWQPGESIRMHLKARLYQYNPVLFILWCMCASWYLWWLLISIGWARYAMPGFFLGSMFTARWLLGLYDATERMLGAREWKLAWRRHAITLTKFVFVTIVVSFSLYRTLIMFAYWLMQTSDALSTTVNYINTRADADTLVETYESELYFLLDPDYHYPPDAVQHAGNERLHLGLETSIDYDVTDFKPDFVVTGAANSWWHIYDEIATGENYTLVYENEPYCVYQIIE